MKRIITIVGITIGSLSLGGIPASAATPAVHACVGKSLSALATTQVAPGDFGHGVSGFAQNSATPGLGLDIQNLQAGRVTNDVVPNTCNGS